jgi:hypothetical protein
MKIKTLLPTAACATLLTLTSCGNWWADTSLGPDLYIDNNPAPVVAPQPQPQPQPQPGNQWQNNNNQQPNNSQPNNPKPGNGNQQNPNQLNGNQQNANQGSPSQGGYRGQTSNQASGSGQNKRH